MNIPISKEAHACQLWLPSAKHRRDAAKENIYQFRKIMNEFPQVSFYWPQYDAAPWHVQAEINGEKYSFWPHVMKANKDGCLSVEGAMRVRLLIEEALKDDDIQLIE